MGGDEFCVIVRDGERQEEATEAASRALSDRGEGFKISSSCGRVELGVEAQDPSGALQLADQRMYAQKEGRRASARRQARDVLLRTLQERQPRLGEHSGEVADLAVAVARTLGLDAEELDVVARASELHDIGKIAIPDAILEKREPLDADEVAFMRRHPAIGDRILSAAPALRPVAKIVRASHERWDGSGYPDGLRGRPHPPGSPRRRGLRRLRRHDVRPGLERGDVRSRGRGESAGRVRNPLRSRRRGGVRNGAQ